MKNKNDFAYYLQKFLQYYLPDVRNLSENTIKSYRDTFIIFIEYCTEVLNIKQNRICFDNISSDMIDNFLIWLTDGRDNTPNTANQRLAALKSFFKYVGKNAPEYVIICNHIDEIKNKKATTKPIDYLTEEAVLMLLLIFDLKNHKQLRECAMVTLMYETACRVEELTKIKASDIRSVGNKATVTVTGKGEKKRKLAINAKVMKLLSAYTKAYNIALGSDEILFRNKQGNKLTRQGVTYILKKYVGIARKNNPIEFSITVSPHIMRHSKATHLLEQGVNLVYIRDFLGHTSVTTTEIYAKCSVELQKKHLKNHSEAIVPDSKYTSDEEKSLTDWLKENI